MNNVTTWLLSRERKPRNKNIGQNTDLAL